MNIRSKIITLVIIFMQFLYVGTASAKESRVNRNILALYDSTEFFNPIESNIIHFTAEVVFNYLGLKVVYHDVSKGLPSEEKLVDTLGIVTWFYDEYMFEAEKYCQWASDQIKGGKKFLILGNMGSFYDAKSRKQIPWETVNLVFNSLGLQYDGRDTTNPILIEVVKADKEMVEFERTLDYEIGKYKKITSLSDSNRTYLQLKRKDYEDSLSSVVVATESGGYAMFEYMIYYDLDTQDRRWKINPFKFFEDALGLKGIPRYDTTTLFGKRIAYSHIDGDGFRNISLVDDERLSSKVIYDEILAKYSLPVTVSFVAAEIDTNILGKEEYVDIVRKIASLETTEIGVHGFSHPFDWDKQITAFQINGYSKLVNPYEYEELKDSDYINTAFDGEKICVVTLDNEDYLQKEIVYASKIINDIIVSTKKKVRINHWTGDCKPSARAIEVTKEAGLKNINGGDTRFDRAFPTYTTVAPLYRQVDGQIQVYTSNSNENIYTNHWKDPFYGFRFVIETFKQTEYPSLIHSKAPRRISPINIYYHFYIGERDLSLASIKEVYEYVVLQDIIPIFTTQYVSIVEGFLNGEVVYSGKDSWILKDYGDARTVRFDFVDLYPDLRKSVGVLGFKKWEDYLYVHLDENQKVALVMAKSIPQEPYVDSSSCIINQVRMGVNKLSFIASGFDKKNIIFKNLKPNSNYHSQIRSISGGKGANGQVFKTDAEGTLVVSLDDARDLRIEIERDR